MSSAATSRGTLVLVTGTGRSGTSTIAGSLHHLGLEVPGPYLGTNESNPKGFFESRWAVRFHKRITHAAGITDMDSRPTALARAHSAVTSERREELVAFLRDRASGHSQVVIKDPRSVWVQRLWREAANDAGLDIRYLSMLRHPAEVIGSRATYYSTKSDVAARRRYEILSIARWVNNSLISEHETRGQRRTFVKYLDLLEDWRPAVAKVAAELGLTYEGDLTPGVHHQVDDFIDPDLRRVRVTWDDLEIPEELQEIAQGVWEALIVLFDAGGQDDGASAQLDQLSARYSQLFAIASAITQDATEQAAAEGRSHGAAEERARQAKKRAEAATAGGGAGPHAGTSPALADRRVGEVGGRDLLKVAGGRLLRRLRRR
ncbi:MAG: hypothetical protein ABWX84_07030 [Nocardioides sp.]